MQYFPYVKYAWNETLISVKCIKKKHWPGHHIFSWMIWSYTTFLEIMASKMRYSQLDFMIVILSWTIFRGKPSFFIHPLEAFKSIVAKWKSKNKFEIHFKKSKRWNSLKKKRKKKEKDNSRSEVAIFLKTFRRKEGDFRSIWQSEEIKILGAGISITEDYVFRIAVQ